MPRTSSELQEGEEVRELEEWLSTDEQLDVLLSLEEVQHQVERVASGKRHCWKWAIIALASALNGALTCNLTGTMGVGALRKDDAKQSIAALQKNASITMPSRPQLAPPAILLKRARGEIERIERAGPILVVNTEQTWAFDRLFDFRNAFVHFEPLTWSIQTSGMARIFEQVLTILDQLTDDGWSFRRLEADDCARLKNARNDLRLLLAKLQKPTA